MKTEEISPWRSNRLIFKNLGKYFVIFVISYVLFEYVFSFPKPLSFIFSLIFSYLIVKLVDKGRKK